ncbi:AP2/ERF domain-containing protein PFD0985w [Nilaparvata lugens]|uniref:AP2/ERF domain-containing protein PFD0985w n=1 Tax=Nilaparvata lugens TaxID=108931 RepID=UPI00193DD779|nr:AP2/ERF domain-containing protein PFD0985w [Nilaparvata lugens]
MLGRCEADFRAHRNRRKSRLGKFNSEVERPIALPSSIVCAIAPRRTLGSRMNQVLYQEAALKRKKEAVKANPKKCLFSEPENENADNHYPSKIQKSATYSMQYGFSSSEDHDETGVFPMDDPSKTRVLGVRNMEPQDTSGQRLPLKDHNFRSTTNKPAQQLFKNHPTEAAKKCLPKQLTSWNLVQSPVLPKLSGFTTAKTPYSQKSKHVDSPVMPRLSTFPLAVKTTIKINAVPPEENSYKSKDFPHKNGSLKCRDSDNTSNSNYSKNGGQTQSTTDITEMLTFKYPITDIPNYSSADLSTMMNFKYPTSNNDPRSERLNLKNPVNDALKDSSSSHSEVKLNFKYPVTDEPKGSNAPVSEFVPNFKRYPVAGELNDCSRNQTQSSNCNNYGRQQSVTDSSKLSNFDFPVSGRANDCASNPTKPSNSSITDSNQVARFERDVSNDYNNQGMMSTFKMEQMTEKQRKKSISEMEFEKICQMKNDGSQSLLLDFCLNGKSVLEENGAGNSKENVQNNDATNNHGERRSVSSNNMNGNGTRRSISSNMNGNGPARSISSNMNGNGARRSISNNTMNGNVAPRSISSNFLNENVVHHSKLKQPNFYASKVESKLQPSGADLKLNKKLNDIRKDSSNFVIHKRKDSFISSDTLSEDDSFNLDTILINNYESSTLIVNEPIMDASVKDVENIDETLSNIQLNDVGETFVVTSNMPRKLFLGGDENVSSVVDNVEGLGKTFLVGGNIDGTVSKENNVLSVVAPYPDRKRSIGETFLVPHKNVQKVLFDDKKFCQENKESILKASAFEVQSNQSIDMGVEMLNESLDTTLRFVQNETLCENENEATMLESGVKNRRERDGGVRCRRNLVDGMSVDRNLEEENGTRRNNLVEENATKTLEGEINVGRDLGEQISAGRSLVEKMDVNVMRNNVIDFINTGEEEIYLQNNRKIADNCQFIPQHFKNSTTSVEVSKNEVPENNQRNDSFINEVMKRQKLLIQKSEELFRSRRQIMAQIKVLEKSLIEQEDQFIEINREFCDLVTEFGEVVINQKVKAAVSDKVDTVSSKRDTVTTEIDTVSKKDAEKLTESVIVPFSVRKNAFDTPRSARRVRRNLVFSQLKSDFSCLKTPLPSTTKKLQESTANKTILTPKSMSVCIQDQVNQLFDS